MTDLRFVIITGLSGAGKSQAIRSLEDLDYFCVDNLPPTLLGKFAELCTTSNGRINKVALVIDIRGGEFFGSLFGSLEQLEKEGVDYEILFLEASDEVLIRRFKETRRPHPLAPQGRVAEGIKAERARLEQLRGRASKIIDTSELTPHQLKEKVTALFTNDPEQEKMGITVVSFGFKHGIPLDADMVFDVRFLPNPHWVQSLRPLTGEHPDVYDYVMKWPVTQKFVQKLTDMIDYLIPYYIKEGKTQLVIAIGCTGGCHRSVALAIRLHEYLRLKFQRVSLEHRDIATTEREEVKTE